MSEQAKELIAQADKDREAGRNQAALDNYDKAIALDPTNNYSWGKRGYILDQLARHQEAAESYEKAIELGNKEYAVIYDLGYIYTFNIPKREEAVALFDRAREIDSSKLGHLLLDRGNALMALGRLDDARVNFVEAANVGSPFTETYAMAGSLCEDAGLTAEALKYFDQGLALKDTDYKCLLLKGNFLLNQGKTQEALACYQKIIDSTPNDSITNYRMAGIYTSLGEPEKAKECYERGAKMNAGTASAWASKGQCLNMIGETENAMQVFKKVQHMLETDNVSISAPWFIKNTKAALKAVLEAEEAAKHAEAEISKLDQNIPAVQKFVTNIKVLQEKKIAAQNKVLDQASKNNKSDNQQDLASLDQITEGFKKELAELKKELSEFKKEVKTEIKTIKSDVGEIREELSSKMDDFHTKLDNELKKQDLPEADRIKLKAYFSAFIGTFSSAHVSAQVIDSGMVQLSDSNAASILSFMASFTPFIGSALETGIKSIGDFLETKEMKSNARKLKKLAPDAVVLSQVIGKTGFTILTNHKKQQQILTTTDEELNEITGNVFKKLYKFCEQVNDKIDAYLYTDLYKTAPERIGHNDANELIEAWTKGDIMPYSIDDQFSKLILKPYSGQAEQRQKESSTNSVAQVERGRSSCCNMF